MAVQETFESKFWRYLNDARYREWAPVSGTSGDAYEGQSPHGAMLKMYLSRKAAGLPNDLPTGSVIVKENYAADGKTLMAVTTMYKARNYDQAGTGWYWTKYNPDGSVATKDGKRLAGKVQGCIECHASAAGGDYAFFND
ncbi:MAG: cytochrome P460 family protein [Pirellulales bacterium]|nr:cytochrome P460 family protein [Pirellulales bacterium]